MLDAPLADARAFLNQTPALHTKTLAPWTLSSFSILTCVFTAIPRLDPTRQPSMTANAHRPRC